MLDGIELEKFEGLNVTKVCHDMDETKGYCTHCEFHWLEMEAGE